MNFSLKNRKQDHLDICLNQPIEHGSTGFENYSLIHQALPDYNLKDIDLSVKFLGKKLQAPIIIASMTGGTDIATKMNQQLAQIAEEFNIGMGVGSQRIAIKNSKPNQDFQLRKWIPNSLLLGNLGAIQLNYGFSIKHYQLAVDMLQADGLYLHLNPLQEALQPEGETNFAGLEKKLLQLKKNINVPIIIKEVGQGISTETAKKLKKMGFSIIEATGKGGVSWTLIETIRSKSSMGATFADWGISTAKSLENCRKVPGLTIIAGGGIRTGIDIAKSICLGASLISIGLPILKAVNKSKQAAKEYLQTIIKELKIALFCLGVKNLEELKKNSKVLLKKNTN